MVYDCVNIFLSHQRPAESVIYVDHGTTRDVLAVTCIALNVVGGPSRSYHGSVDKTSIIVRRTNIFSLLLDIPNWSEHVSAK